MKKIGHSNLINEGEAYQSQESFFLIVLSQEINAKEGINIHYVAELRLLILGLYWPLADYIDKTRQHKVINFLTEKLYVSRGKTRRKWRIFSFCAPSTICFPQVPLNSKSLCKNMASASGGANNMHPLSGWPQTEKIRNGINFVTFFGR